MLGSGIMLSGVWEPALHASILIDDDDDDDGGKITLVGRHFGNAVNTNYVCSNPL